MVIRNFRIISIIGVRVNHMVIIRSTSRLLSLLYALRFARLTGCPLSAHREHGCGQVICLWSRGPQYRNVP